jgi:hypothetical protein
MKISVLPQELYALCRPVFLLVQQVAVHNTYICVAHYVNIAYIGKGSVVRETRLHILNLVEVT